MYFILIQIIYIGISLGIRGIFEIKECAKRFYEEAMEYVLHSEAVLRLWDVLLM